jgi:type IX secretion system PorP/SprF family membrane protein
MKRNIIFLFFLFSVITVFGQQDPQFSQNMFNNMSINPAYAGMNNSICATLFDRMQWVGFTDNTYGGSVWPKTELLSVDGPISPIHGGVGVTIMNDQLGLQTSTDFKLAYSYHIAAGPGTLGIGAQVGFYNEKINYGGFQPVDKGDPLLTPPSKQSNIAADVAAGLFYNIPNKLYFGVSACQLLQSSVNYSSTEGISLARNYYISAGYYYPIPSNPSLEIDPSLLIKSDLSSTQYDINCLLKYNNKFWGGLSWRPTDAVVVMIGMNVYQGLLVGYSYDITTSAMGADHRSSGSHEIMVHYCLKVLHELHPESYHNTRFL